MTFDWKKFDPLTWLRPRKISEEEKRYGTFNRRMMAASFDSLLVTLLIAPLVDYIFIQTYGMPGITMQELAERIPQNALPGEAMQILLREMHASGLWDRFIANLKWQFYAYAVFSTICWHFWSATPGKMLCGLRVIDAKTGGRMGDWQSILRVLGYIVSSVPLGFGFFWIGMNKKRRGWHDYLAGTLVVRTTSITNATSMPESARPSDSPAPSAAE